MLCCMIPYFQMHLDNIFQDNVKWSVYNQSRVKRGELLLAFDVIGNLDIELKEMDKDKVG